MLNIMGEIFVIGQEDVFKKNIKQMVFKNLAEESDKIRMSAMISGMISNTYLTSTHTFTPKLEALLQPILDEIAKSDEFISALKAITGRNIMPPALYSSLAEGDIFDINLVFGKENDQTVQTTNNIMEGKTIKIVVREVVRREAELVIGKDITELDAKKLLTISQDCERGSKEYDLINKYLVSNSTDCNDIDPEDSEDYTSIDIELED
jgi:hypothetical protein